VRARGMNDLLHQFHYMDALAWDTRSICASSVILSGVRLALCARQTKSKDPTIAEVGSGNLGNSLDAAVKIPFWGCAGADGYGILRLRTRFGESCCFAQDDRALYSYPGNRMPASLRIMLPLPIDLNIFRI
jgi:hypothetical protein